MKTFSINSESTAFLSNKSILIKNYFAHRFWFDIKNILIWIFSIFWAIRSVFYILILLSFIFWGIPKIQKFSMQYKWNHQKYQYTDDKALTAFTNDLINITNKQTTKFNNLIPRSNYLVINSTENEFFLFKNRELVRTGKCSTGSYILLKSENSQEWIFKTPKGMFSIKGKITNPVWKKPDWAFVEEGLPIPKQNDPSRYEYGVLGDYALSLGDGYMLHGTLYKRFIGLPVTHGCVRLGDDDLEAIYKALSVGSKVIIY